MYICFIVMNSHITQMDYLISMVYHKCIFSLDKKILTEEFIPLNIKSYHEHFRYHMHIIQ